MSEKCFLCVCRGRRGPSRQIIEFGVDRLRPRCSVVEDLLRSSGRGDYHGPLSIEVEDPLMPNNLVAIQKSAVISEYSENLLSHANECVKGGFHCLTRIDRLGWICHLSGNY